MYDEFSCDCCSDEEAEVVLWGRDRDLQHAITSNDIQAAQRAIAAGANINARDDQHGTILQTAVLSRNEEAVRLLLSHGVNVNAGGHVIYGTTLGAAARTCYNDNIAILKLLLDNGANPNGVSYTPPLQFAAEGTQTAAVQLLLEAGADVNARGGQYGTALQAACHYGYEPTVKALLDAGADINLQGGYHGDALQAAARHGRVELVKMLLDAGADPTAQCGVYGSALKGAQERGHPEVVQILEDAIAGRRRKLWPQFLGNWW